MLVYMTNLRIITNALKLFAIYEDLHYKDRVTLTSPPPALRKDLSSSSELYCILPIPGITPGIAPVKQDNAVPAVQDYITGLSGYLRIA